MDPDGVDQDSNLALEEITGPTESSSLERDFESGY